MLKKIVTALVLLVSIFTAGAQQQTQTKEAPINIVLFIADDLGTIDTGPYGNTVVNTPNMDQLSKESLQFNRAFASSPTCGPSRSTIFTGLMPFRHGADGNHSGVKKGTRSLVHYMKPLNYRVAIAGKYHVGPEELFPFERIENTNVPEPGFEEKPGLHFDLNMDPVDEWLSKQQKNQPFMLVVADHSPHVVWSEETSYDPENVDIPEQHINTPETRKSRARYYEDITKMDRNLGKLLKSLDRNGLSDNTIVIFTSDQGPQWAFAKWSLYDYGVQVPLLVRWPGEVQPNTTTKAMVSLADLLPTFVEIGGGVVPEKIDGKSFLSVLKGEKDKHREVIFATHTGDARMNRSPARMVRTNRFKYILNLAPDILYTTHMDKADDHDGGREYWDSWREKSFTDEHAKAILWRYHHRPKEELYDLESDPNEMHNLANNPKYAELLEDFRIKLDSWREQQGDFETGPEELSNKRKRGVAPYVF